MWALRSLHTPLGRGALRWERMDVCGVRGRWCCSFLPLPGSGQQHRTGSPLSLAAPQLEQRMSGSGCEHHYTRGEAHGLWALLPGFSWSFPPWGAGLCGSRFWDVLPFYGHFVRTRTCVCFLFFLTKITADSVKS